MKLIYTLIFFQLCLFTQAANETHYVGAVVDFSPTIGNVSENALRFQKFIQDAKSKDADIIVFPEIGLNGYGTCSDGMLTLVPEPGENSMSPCDDSTSGYTEAFKTISCAARDAQIYVVFNVAEQVPCTKGDGCPPRGYLKYNTNVVLNRKGVVIARYRKFNLFGEIGTNVTSKPDLTVFDTDFGVRFGTFICFDLLFETPTLTLLREKNISNIVYSTAWFSELPFLTAVQVQQGFAHSQNITFLGSGYNDLPVGSGGSGIYVGRSGSLGRIFPDQTTSQLIVASIPKNGETSLRESAQLQPMSQNMFLKRENLEAYVSAPIQSSTKLCHNELCCDFSINVTAPTESVPYVYRALVFNGVRTFDNVATGGIQTCAITTCDSDEVTSCGTRVNSKHVFTSIKITGKFKAEHAVQVPSTLTNENELLPLNPDAFSYSSHCNDIECEISISLTKPQNSLITFGIYGRDFSKDGQPVTPKSSKASFISFSSFVVATLAALAVIN